MGITREHLENQLRLTRELNENMKQQQKMYAELLSLQEDEIKLREKMDVVNPDKPPTSESGVSRSDYGNW